MRGNVPLEIDAGIGFDVPASPRDDPETVYDATVKAFAAGAHGIVVSREYEEMKLEHLRAVGRAVRQVMPVVARPLDQ